MASEEEVTADPVQAEAQEEPEKAADAEGDKTSEEQTDNSSAKPYKIPKLSERSESSEDAPENISSQEEANGTEQTTQEQSSAAEESQSSAAEETQSSAVEEVEDDATVKVTVEEEQHSDTELLVDETLEVQSEVNNDDKTEDENETDKKDSKKENGTSERRSRRRSRSRSRHRSRSHSRSRYRSRSRSYDRRRRERHLELRETSSDHPDMIRSRVFVGHLDTDRVTKDEVRHLFSAYGKVVGIALHQGYGFVQYDNADSAKAAIKEAHGTPVHGMKIVVDKTVKLKKLLGEDPHSEPPLPKDPPRRRDRMDDYDLDYYRRRDLQNRYSRLEELERRMLYDRYERLPPPPPPPRRDPYYDSYYDRPPPPSFMDSYDRPRYSEYDRERERFAERERYAAARERDMYLERRRDDFYHDDYRGASDYPPYRY